MNREEIAKAIMLISRYMSQSEAAALAVLAAHCRENVTDRDVMTSQDQEVVELFQMLEDAAVSSIERNDGRVVHWIGLAAKQMNPLLS